MTAHMSHEVTEPRTLPQFKRQSVPGCSIILNASPPDPEEMALLISTEQITEESHPNPAPHLTQSPALNRTTSSVLHLQGTFGCSPASINKIMSISFFRCSSENLWEKTLSIYCVEIKVINSIIRSYSHCFALT